MLAAGGFAAPDHWKAQTGDSIPPFDADNHDWRKIELIAQAHLGVDVSDCAVWGEFWQRVVARALALVQRPDIWSAIEAVARELERHAWTLTGAPLKAALESVPRQDDA